MQTDDFASRAGSHGPHGVDARVQREIQEMEGRVGVQGSHQVLGCFKAVHPVQSTKKECARVGGHMPGKVAGNGGGTYRRLHSVSSSSCSPVLAAKPVAKVCAPLFGGRG
jgi:hypothetical protein